MRFVDREISSNIFYYFLVGKENYGDFVKCENGSFFGNLVGRAFLAGQQISPASAGRKKHGDFVERQNGKLFCFALGDTAISLLAAK